MNMRVLMWVVLLPVVSFGSAGSDAVISNVNQPYEELVKRAIRERAEKVSLSLRNYGFIPEESFDAPVIQLDMKVKNPEGCLHGSVCDYWFSFGELNRIRRFDLIQDKGPQTKLLEHLTNAPLKWKRKEAEARAFQFLGAVGYDAEAIRRAYRVTVREEWLDATLLRDAGTNINWWQFGTREVASRRPILSVVELERRKMNRSDTWRPKFRVKFLETNGELFEATLPFDLDLHQVNIAVPEKILVTRASDFTPPTYLFAIRTRKNLKTPVESEALALLAECWQELQVKLGTNRPKAFVICENLSCPKAIANEFTQLAGPTPWIGFSQHWDEKWERDIRVYRIKTDKKRGVMIRAICGDVMVSLSEVSNIEYVPHPPPPVSEEAERERNEEMRKRFRGKSDELIQKISLPKDLPEHATVLFCAGWSAGTRVVCKEAWEFFGDRTLVREIFGNSLYLNGTVSTNAIGVLTVSGFLPLDYHPIPARRGNKPALNPQVYYPLTDVGQPFFPLSMN